MVAKTMQSPFPPDVKDEIFKHWRRVEVTGNRHDLARLVEVTRKYCPCTDKKIKRLYEENTVTFLNFVKAVERCATMSEQADDAKH